MLNHQIIGLASGQFVFQIPQPFPAKILVHRVHNRNLLIQDHIGVICHTVRHHILALKQVHCVVIYADVLDIIGNKHI